MSPSCSNNNGGETRKRVPKACDRCRLKKVKCDGNMPCPRCKMEDAVCHFGQRRKSIERSISPGYVDQIELQQKILIKALKETWIRWAPTELRLQAGQEPSIHTIVRALDVVQGITDHQAPIPEDFTFSETLTGRHDDAFAQDVSSFDNILEFSTPSSESSNLKGETVFSHKDSVSTTSSRAQSVAASTRSSIYSFSPLSTQTPTSIKTELQHASPINGKASRPTFCPLPPRLSTMLVVPTRFDIGDSGTLDSIDDYQQPNFAMPDWQTNNDMGLDASLMPPLMDMDFAAYPNQIATPDAWKSWVNDHPDNQQMNMLKHQSLYAQ